MRQTAWLATLAVGALLNAGMLPACTSSASGAIGGSGGSDTQPPTLPGGAPSGGSGGALTGQLSSSPEPALDASQEPSSEVMDYTAVADTHCPGVDSAKQQRLRMSVGDGRSLATAERAKEALEQDRAPLPSEIRGEDFYNYFRDPSPAAADPKASVTLQLRHRTVAGLKLPEQLDLLVQVDAARHETRPDLALTVLVDTGPAMPPDALDDARTLLRSLGKYVTPSDKVSVLTSDPNGAAFVVDTAQASAELDQAAALLSPSDTSDLSAALQRAYQWAQDPTHVGTWNRVLLVSNGYAGTPSDITSATAAATQNVPILLNVASVGPAESVADGLLRSLSTAGRGAYFHVSGPAEPDRLFSQRFDELFGVLFDDVHVEVVLPWFMSLTDEPVPTVADDVPYLAPGGSMRFLRQIHVCHQDLTKKLGTLKISASVTGKVPGAGSGAAGPIVESSRSVQEMLTDTAPLALETYVATRAFVEALKGPTLSRLGYAEQLLVPLSQTNANSAAKEMLSLLQRHPGLSNQ